jgi:hypothetical protein
MGYFCNGNATSGALAQRTAKGRTGVDAGGVAPPAAGVRVSLANSFILVHFIAIYVDCNKALKSTNLCMPTY